MRFSNFRNNQALGKNSTVQFIITNIVKIKSNPHPKQDKNTGSEWHGSDAVYGMASPVFAIMFQRFYAPRAEWGVLLASSLHDSELVDVCEPVFGAMGAQGPLSSWQFVTACHVMNEFHSRYAVFDFYTEAVSGWGHRLGSPISCHGNLRLGSPKQFRMWSTHRLQISSCSAICLRGSAASERSSGIPAIVCVAHFFPPACQPPSAPESQHC